jgi:hypothetical protein
MTVARLQVLVALIFFTLSSMSGAANAQTPDLEADRPGSPIPIVTFEIVRPGVNPPHYAIAVESAGRAAYRADEKTEQEVGSGAQTEEPYFLKFTVSEPNRSLIFELAKQANMFKGDFDYTKSRIANTGIKTLAYSEGRLADPFQYPVEGIQNKTTYNWSENVAIQELTRIFEGMQTTLEFGRRLEFERRFDKLGLDQELKRLQELQKSGQAQEVQAIEAVLTNISNDLSVMHVARQRAREILNASRGKSQG